jgi:hypothetical protein
LHVANARPFRNKLAQSGNWSIHQFPESGKFLKRGIFAKAPPEEGFRQLSVVITIT